MAPRQNTFTLVPNPLGMQGLMSRPANGPPSRPPMTSKQAQKLYKQANRQPRMSKEEQRRFERQEQERIRQELDKEKQAAKARTLREKKKAKEQQALQEKKRKGVPLVSVRPSQDTIARFIVRGNGVGKKRDSAGAMVHCPAATEEKEEECKSDAKNASHEDTRVPTEEKTSTSQCKRRRVSHLGSQDDSTAGMRAGNKGREVISDAAGNAPQDAPVSRLRKAGLTPEAEAETAQGAKSSAPAVESVSQEEEKWVPPSTQMLAPEVDAEQERKPFTPDIQKYSLEDDQWVPPSAQRSWW